MRYVLLVAAVLVTLILRDAGHGWAHAGSSSPVPRGCHIVVEKVVVNGVEIALRRVSCPAPKSPPTS